MADLGIVRRIDDQDKVFRTFAINDNVVKNTPGYFENICISSVPGLKTRDVIRR